MQIKIVYTDGSEEVLEGTEIVVMHNCFQVKQELESTGMLIAAVQTTNSIYVPMASVRKMITLNT